MAHRAKLLRFAIGATSLIAMACGARTPLDEPAWSHDAGPEGCAEDPECDDGVGCTVDRCVGGRCRAEADSARCGIGRLCELDEGCVVRAFVIRAGALASLDFGTGDIEWLDRRVSPFEDIALGPDGRLFGAPWSGGLWTVDPETGRTLSMIDGDDRPLLGLEFSAGGELFGSIEDAIVSVDPVTGRLSLVAELPGDVRASGDIAVLDDALYATVRPRLGDHLPSDVLVRANPSDHTVTTIGAVGQPCVWGLAPHDHALYGVTCVGRVIRIDPATGRSELLNDLGRSIAFTGATAR